MLLFGRTEEILLRILRIAQLCRTPVCTIKGTLESDFLRVMMEEVVLHHTTTKTQHAWESRIGSTYSKDDDFLEKILVESFK